MLYFNGLNEKVKDIWFKMPNEYHGLEVKYDKNNDKALLALSKKLKNHLKSMSFEEKDDQGDQELLSEIKFFAYTTLHMTKQTIDTVLKNEYLNYSQSFIKRAKALEPEITREGIFQALRNVWTLHSMQLYFGKQVTLTDAMFAYSMLYPLTDNYLDNPDISKETKSEFNHRFRLKIKTGKGRAESEAEAKIFSMIDMIEGDWPREQYPMVYESLMGILDGQQLSLYQQHMDSLYDKDMLSIVFYKGGTSVLADAYLIKGKLNEEEELFAYLYGVILQLADDLQDVNEDLKQEHYTMMNVQGTFGDLDVIIHKLLCFIEYFLENHYATRTPEQEAIKELTSTCIQMLVFQAMLKLRKPVLLERYVSKDFYDTICKSSWFSVKTYAKVEKELQKHLDKALKSL